MPYLARATLSIDDLAAIDSSSTVYNFEVAETQTYLVGKQGILVHNGDCKATKFIKKTNPTPSDILGLEAVSLDGTNKNRFNVYNDNHFNKAIDIELNDATFNQLIQEVKASTNKQTIGTKSEKVADAFFTSPNMGYTSYDAKIGGDNGFDGVYFKPAIDLNKPLSKISFESCIIYELKPLARTFEEINGKQEWTGNGIALNPKNGDLPTQMSVEWDDDVLRRMRAGTDPNKQKLAQLIQNARTNSKLTKTVSAVNRANDTSNSLILFKLPQ